MVMKSSEITFTADSIGKFARVCGFTADASRAAAVGDFATRVQSLPAFARKMLAHIAELAYSEHHDGRKPGVAYFPELHETSGVGVDEMYALLQEIECAGLIRLEGEYPFQNVVPADVQLSGQASWPVLHDVARFCSSKRIPLRDLLVDLRFDEWAR
jgi:hypothetical protein